MISSLIAAVLCPQILRLTNEKKKNLNFTVLTRLDKIISSEKGKINHAENVSFMVCFKNQFNRYDLQ